MIKYLCILPICAVLTYGAYSEVLPQIDFGSFVNQSLLASDTSADDMRKRNEKYNKCKESNPGNYSECERRYHGGHVVAHD